MPHPSIAALLRASSETCRSLGVACGPRALDQQSRADLAQARWASSSDLEGLTIASRVAWSVGPPAHPLDRLASWTDRQGRPAALSVARSMRSWVVVSEAVASPEA